MYVILLMCLFIFSLVSIDVTFTYRSFCNCLNIVVVYLYQNTDCSMLGLRYLHVFFLRLSQYLEEKTMTFFLRKIFLIIIIGCFCNFRSLDFGWARS